jgi:HEPN domain-containing protein
MADPFSLWITPEVERRTNEGLIPPGFQLLAAQIVFWPDGKDLEVRLNEEVRFLLGDELIKGVNPKISKVIGKHVSKIRPPPDEADAAHVTLIRVSDTWVSAFDFTYNNARIANTYNKAQEFLETACEAADGRRYSAFIDTLFSAVELMAKSLSLGFPNPTKITQKHRGIAIDLNMSQKHNVVGGDFAGLLNELKKLRHPARYGLEKFQIEVSKVNELRARADDMLKLVENQLTPRARELMLADWRARRKPG